MKAATHLQVSTPQGNAGELTQEQGQFLFGYGPASADAAIKQLFFCKFRELVLRRCARAVSQGFMVR